MRAAFKEWAVVVDALGHGGQILILRKGGLAEGPGGFQMEHPRFLLFPTLFHQQRESVIPAAQARFDELAPNFPPPDKIRLQYFAEVVFSGKLHSIADANALHGQHVWRDEVIAQRFDWGRDKAIFALAVRVYRLPQILEITSRSDYAGCKSWVELDHEISAEASDPVLANDAFETKLNRLRETLGDSARAESLSVSNPAA
jgi:hypothetical protein